MDSKHLYPMQLRDEIEEYLTALRFSADPLTAGLEQAMRYSLLAGGKRVRPVLVLATARALGIDHRSVLPLAAAIELIHTLSLIHDDLPAMDDADLRRGQPSSHRVHGEAVAILAGDTLFAEAFQLLLCHVRASPERVLNAAALIAKAVGTDGMAGGQYIDITGADDDEAVLRCHRLKTAALIEASVHSVVVLTESPDPKVVAALRTYAAELGLMFQIVDDILDGQGSSTATGKPEGSDVRNGRRTIITAGNVVDAVRFADRCLARIRDCLDVAPCSSDELLDVAVFVRQQAPEDLGRTRTNDSH